MKTFSAKPTDVNRKWYVVDASDAILGRLATQVASLLLGKGKPQFTSHIDCGDYVVVINSDKLVVTGDKDEKKIYYHHTPYPGGIKSITLGDQRTKDSTQIIVKAVRGMLPTNKLREDRLMRLKVYAGSDHKHEAQNPEKLDLKGSK